MNLRSVFSTVVCLIISICISSAQTATRSINILTADKSGQTILKQLVKTAKNPVTILPANQEKADEALYYLIIKCS
ncbi:hypothetical protein HDC91_000956 [Mucilaginibacter sp. AK015]|nr:hypothetical protein [Mucilaginibacter sp. AK015]